MSFGKRVLILFVSITLCFSVVFTEARVVFAEGETTYDPQSYWEYEHADAIGNKGRDQNNDIVALPDGGYITIGDFAQTVSIGGSSFTSKGSTDVYVVRYNANNEVVFATSLGSGALDAGRSVALTSDGGYVISGQFAGEMTVGDKTLTPKGSNDAFVVRFDAENNIVFADSFGSDGSDGATSIAATDDGGFIVAGNYTNEMEVGGTSLAPKGSASNFIVRYDADNEIVSAIGYGRASSYTDIVATPSGEAIVTGGFFGTMEIGDYTLESKGSSDIYIIKIDSDNQVVHAESFGAAGADMGTVGTGISLFPDGGYMVTGLISGNAEVGGVTLEVGGGNTAFVIRYDSNDQIVNAFTIPSTSISSGTDVEVCADGGYIVSGYFSGNMAVGEEVLEGKAASGQLDIFIIRYNENDEPIWQTSFGEVGAAMSIEVAETADGGIAAAGSFNSTLVLGSDTFTNTNGRLTPDIFIAKFKKTEFLKEIAFTKKDKDTGDTLEGAKFILRKADIDKYYIDALTFGDKEQAAVFTSDSEGKFNIDFRVKGIYFLEEIESPEGYRKNNFSYIIKVDKEGFEVIEASDIKRNEYTENLSREPFETRTVDLIDENKSDRYQMNHQAIEQNGYTIKKQAEWTDIEAGKAKITIKITRPPLKGQDENLDTRVVYAFTTCTAHGFSRELAKRNINQLIKNYKTVDLIIANGPSINDLVYLKDVKDAEAALNGIRFMIDQHWGINLYTGLHNYFKTETPGVVYTSFDILTLTDDGDTYTDDSTWEKLKEYEEAGLYYPLTGDFRYDKGQDTVLRWKTIAALISPSSWTGFEGDVDIESLRDKANTYGNDFRTLNIDVDPFSTRETVAKSIFEDVLADKLSITSVEVSDDAPFKVTGNKVRVDLTDIDVNKEITLVIEGEVIEESASSEWFDTNDGTAKLEEIRREGRTYLPKEVVEVESPKLAELGFTFEGSSLTEDAGAYTVRNEKITKHDITIKKVDGVTGDALSGAIFTIAGTTDYGKEIKLSEKADAQGVLTFKNVEEGKYTLTETEAPSGYEADLDGIRVIVSKDGAKIYGLPLEGETYIAKNYQPEKMVIKKVDEAGKALSGATFRVFGHTLEGEEVDGDFVTDENGQIELAEGEYTVREITAPDGYVLVADTYFLDKENTSIEVVNKKQKGTITVTKKWSEVPGDEVIPEIVICGFDKNGEVKYMNSTANSPDKWEKSGDTWTYTFEISDLSLNYEAWEELVPGYRSSNTDENPLKVEVGGENIITNTLIRDDEPEPEVEKLSINIKKLWDDWNNLSGRRPEEIVFNVLQNGEKYAEFKMTAQDDTDDNTWEGSIEDLPKTDDEGNTYEYTIEEIEIEWYINKTEGNAKDGFVVTNINRPWMPRLPRTAGEDHKYGDFIVQKTVSGEAEEDKEYEIKLEFLLPDGTTTTVSRNVSPKQDPLEIDHVVAGTNVKVTEVTTGYEVTYTVDGKESQEFSVSEGVTHKVVINNHKPIPPKEETPNTGDDTNMGIWILLMGMCILGVTALARRNKRA